MSKSKRTIEDDVRRHMKAGHSVSTILKAIASVATKQAERDAKVGGLPGSAIQLERTASRVRGLSDSIEVRDIDKRLRVLLWQKNNGQPSRKDNP